ncbi:hypothetical protein [Methylobacterium haplocladii]|uniref:3',5'-cyclic-nucleotide phosphodiesterase n=1 Tax=Methylobacterium haplocladii TaxID=1176176 RepID=A0A512IR90_9HYPH|nr:hypothetical protein [Methylobacterium haplocladii]GEP00235.1 hypothetical protein MHA02_26220 [Methylobacterium haplocladii]GLS61346.1 hypothetical protein GCM10007887_40530 [Methylobacterium haplocladii]
MLVRITLALVTGLGATAAFAAPAAAPATRETLKQYCTGDYLNYCSDYAADTPELKACFKQNNAKLTPDCRAAIASYTKAQKRG